MKENDLVYSIIFDLPKTSDGKLEPINLDDFLSGINDFLSGLQDFNNAIINANAGDIEVISYIQELASGSIKIRLKDFIKVVTPNLLNSFKTTVKENKELTLAAGSDFLQGNYTTLLLLLSKVRDTYLLSKKDKKLDEKSNKKYLLEKINKIIELEEKNLNKQGITIQKINENHLIESINKMYNGIKKTENNVFYQSSESEEKIKIEPVFDIYTDIIVDSKIQKKIVHAEIRIIKPDLEKKSKWGIYWNKHIKCNIIDKSFIEKVHKGFKIGSQMLFIVDIEITEKFDMNGNLEYGKEEYVIVKIKDFYDPTPQFKF
jgi:hypothetical protein